MRSSFFMGAKITPNSISPPFSHHFCAFQPSTTKSPLGYIYSSLCFVVLCCYFLLCIMAEITKRCTNKSGITDKTQLKTFLKEIDVDIQYYRMELYRKLIRIKWCIECIKNIITFLLTNAWHKNLSMCVNVW